MRYSQSKRINTENIRKEKERPGIYIIQNRNKSDIYIGVSENIQHRLQAILYGRADYNQVKKKKKLRRNASYYRRAYTNIEKARKIENRRKSEMRYNDL